MATTQDWRVNPLAPPSQNPFSTALLRRQYWLPERPAAQPFPALRRFYDDVRANLTHWKHASEVPGPMSFPGPAAPVLASSWPRPGPGRHAHSPNWSGVTTRATHARQITWIVGRWTEPVATASGNPATDRILRSSMWIGLNGHAADEEAALPQAGTCQQLEHDGASGTWTSGHHVWFEWWANLKPRADDPSLLLPTYIDLPVAPGDTVWCSIELVPGADYFPDAPEHVARTFLCVEHTPVGGGQRTKTLILPFLMFPPYSRTSGTRVPVQGVAANWIVELPTRIDSATYKAHQSPFLMPALSRPGNPDPLVQFSHCAAGIAQGLGEPVSEEQTLEISHRIHMIDVVHGANGRGVRVLSEVGRFSATADTADVELHVPGNGA